jgi:glutamate-1-semialdehyde 2,1-aminomutase
MSARTPVGTGQSALRTRAASLFPGGVNSPVRSFRSVGGDPLLVVRGEGPYVWDADGTRYLDLVSSWGAIILGHGHPAVARAVSRALGDGMAFGATHPSEIVLGEMIREAMPGVERLRFTSSGSEAVMSAIRVARAATGRDLVVRFSGSYHGHVDSLLVEAGSGVATLGIPGTAGVPAATASATIVLPFNEPTSFTLAFAEHVGRIAAVIVEPVMANSGVISAAPGFLEHVREVTRADGALLIFDEVITGFRVGPGGAQGRLRVSPDLTTLGKVIGGGLPVGAFGGRRELLDLVAPSGPVYQAGTLSGHPLAMAAGAAALAELQPEGYEALERRVTRLAAGLAEAGRDRGREVSVSRAGPLLTLFFRATAPADGEEAMAADRDAYARFFRAMLEQGVLLPPSQFEAWFPGFAHRDEEVDRILEAADRALAAG